jgi:uncharacterized protein YuzE
MEKHNKQEKWIKVKNGWVKGKSGLRFWRDIEKSRIRLTKVLQPRASYTSKYDMFSLIWGGKKINSTIELNFLGKGDLRFDVTKAGTIVGIEIENLSKVLKKFDCDKK